VAESKPEHTHAAEVQTAQVTYYLNTDTGNDANDGLTSGAAVLTWAGILALVEALPKDQAAPLVIVCAGTTAVTFTPLPSRRVVSPAGRTWVIGVPETTLYTGTTSAPATNAYRIYIGANTAFGASVNITTGPRAGNRRTILRTGASYSNTGWWPSNIGAGVGYTVTKPALRFNITAASGILNLAAGSGLGSDVAPLIFVNVELGKTAAGHQLAQITSSHVWFLGCTWAASADMEIGVDGESSISGGNVWDYSWFADLAGIAGLPITSSTSADDRYWEWGLGAYTASTDCSLFLRTGSRIFGSFAVKDFYTGSSFTNMESLGCMGFSMWDNGQIVTRQIFMAPYRDSYIAENTSLINYSTFEMTASAYTITVYESARILLYGDATLNALAIEDNAEVSSQGGVVSITAPTGTALTLSGDASFAGYGNEVITGGASGYGIDARGGGKASFRSAPQSVTGGLGAIADEANTTTWKVAVRAASTANLTLSGAQTVDGVALVAGDLALVKNQASGAQSGIYVVAAGAWTRHRSLNRSADARPGLHVAVGPGGTANANTIWALTTAAPITLGTTALVFEKAGGAAWVTSTSATLAGLGTASTHNVPASGEAGAAEVVLGNDPRLAVARGYYAVRTVTGSDTAVLTDAGGLIDVNAAAANDQTVPPNASVAFSIGHVLTWVFRGAGLGTIVAGSGVTLTVSPGSTLVTQGAGSWVQAVKVDTNTWMVSGHLVAA
jgi:hypothetical protein